MCAPEDEQRRRDEDEDEGNKSKLEFSNENGKMAMIRIKIDAIRFFVQMKLSNSFSFLSLIESHFASQHKERSIEELLL